MVGPNFSRHSKFFIMMKGLCIRNNTTINSKTSGSYSSILCCSADAKGLQSVDFKFDLPEELAEVKVVIHIASVTSG